MATYTNFAITVGYVFIVCVVYIESHTEDTVQGRDNVNNEVGTQTYNKTVEPLHHRLAGRLVHTVRPPDRRLVHTLTQLHSSDAAEQTSVDSAAGDAGIRADVRRLPLVAETVVAGPGSPPDSVPPPGPNALTDKGVPIVDLRPGVTPPPGPPQVATPPPGPPRSDIHTPTTSVTSNTPDVTSNHEHQTIVPEVTVAVTTSETTSQSAEPVTGACASFPCLNGGRCSPEGSTYTCLCGSENGATLFGGYRCEIKVAYQPRLTRLEPGYGPVAGLTTITIHGSSLLLPVDGVYIGRGDNRHRCDVIKSDGRQIVARTPEYKGYLLYLSLPVSVHFAGGFVLPDKLRELVYEYRHDPVLDSVHPLETISRGGTLLTVHGRHLDSVAHPEVKVMLVYRNNTGAHTDSSLYTETKLSFYQACLLTNRTSSLLLCRVPRLDIPAEFLNINAPATETSTLLPSLTGSATTEDNLIQTSPVTEVGPIQTSPETHHVQPEHPDEDLAMRRRRSNRYDKHSARINDVTDHTELEFHMGFVLDGVTSYMDLSDHFALSHFGSIDVFWPPTIVLPDNKRPLVHEPGMVLNIQGDNFLRGVGADDYTVDVAGGRCETVFVNYSLISCILPQEAPPGDRTPAGGAMIVVHVGTNVKIAYGEIIYESSVNVRLVVGVVAGVVAAVTSLAVGVSLIWLIRRRSRKPRKKYHYGPLSRTLPPPILMEGSRSRLSRQTSDHSSFVSLKPDIIMEHMDAEDRRTQSPGSTLSRAEYPDHGAIENVYRKVSPRARRVQSPSGLHAGDTRAKSVPVGEPLPTSPGYSRNNDGSSLSNLHRVTGNKQQPRLEDVYVNHHLGNNKGQPSDCPQDTEDYANLHDNARAVPKPQPKLPERSTKRDPARTKIVQKNLSPNHQDVPKRKTKTLPASHKNLPLPRIPTKDNPKDQRNRKTGKAAPSGPAPLSRTRSSSHSEDEDDIYMNSPIKSRGFSRTRSSGMATKHTATSIDLGRSSTRLNPKGATLWR